MKKIKLETHSDQRGILSFVENVHNFKIKRAYFIYNLKKDLPRGRHKHKKNKQIFICMQGKVLLKIINGNAKKNYLLKKPNEAVILDPKDWHEIVPKSKNTIILVLASEKFSERDYIYEK